MRFEPLSHSSQVRNHEHYFSDMRNPDALQYSLSAAVGVPSCWPDFYRMTHGYKNEMILFQLS